MEDSMTGRGWVGKAHHARSTAGAWLHQTQVKLVQISTRERKGSPASHFVALQENCGIHRHYVWHKCLWLPSLA